ncbi:MAG: LysM peptidoglycan-binding domain-containing protein [Nitriliruptorales bacterium]|nr:LysM peptidoglycan-binding domain-containing protein [Nitriliruptorales bacterium]
MRSRITLLLLLAADLAGTWWLHAAGDQPWARLSASVAPEVAVVGGLRLVALVLGWWVAASTLLYLVAWLGRIRPLVAVAGRVTLPVARRLVEGALAASLTFSTISPAMAAPPIPPPASERVEADLPDRAPPAELHPPGTGDAPAWLPRPDAAVEPRATAPPDRERAAPSTAPAPRTHVVQPGEHLWAIAAHAVRGAPPEEIGRYWRRLVRANGDRIRSGDPDLIYPGEVVHLPPTGS